jgi:GNAT superfamily N-acetyltransferase
MKLLVRPPRDGEWGICRMLLPETFADAYTREYLLSVRDEAPHIVAAASFRPETKAITRLRMHVVTCFRHRGVGSGMIEHLVRSGASAIEGTVEVTKERGAEQFCERNRFERVDALTTVEAEIAGMREYMRRLRGRISPPPGGCAIPLRAAPMDQVARLHAQYVAHEGEPNAWRALVADTPGIHQSTVVMVDGQVVGILLWELEGLTAVVRSRVVAPVHQGAWVNAMLLAEGLDGAWDSGARRVRFSYTDSNRDTQKLATRFQAGVVSVVARFSRRVAS